MVLVSQTARTLTTEDEIQGGSIMATKRTPAPATTTQRVHVPLPAEVASEEVAWPGQAASANSRNAELRKQLIAEVGTMQHGSTRSYAITGDKEQAAFLNLFRSVVSSVHADKWGVQAVRRDNDVVVRIGDKITRQRSK